MKIILWSIVFFCISSNYAKTADYILTMSIADRQYFFTSVKEVADAYKENSRQEKANSFYRSAIDIYPIGDMAHQLANQLGITLDDDKTYSNFVLMGDKAVENQQYQYALSHYLMANELWNSTDVYRKIAEVYEALNDMDKSVYYEDLAQGLSEKEEEMNEMFEVDYQETIN
ncbi:MAG: hypothetical protein ACRC0X_04210 [Brevinema sp.]